jgi:hypothetical protein
VDKSLVEYARKCARKGCNSAAAGYFEAIPDRNGIRPAGREWCSPFHREADIVDDLRKPHCPVCGKVVDSPKESLVGRPKVYCGRDCQSAREKQLARALKDLAREVMPEDVDGERLLMKVRAAIYDAEILWDFWRGAWGVKPTVPPSPRARQALADRVTALGERKRVAVQLKDSQLREQARVKEDRQLRAHRERQAAEDRKWRDELVKGLG